MMQEEEEEKGEKCMKENRKRTAFCEWLSQQKVYYTLYCTYNKIQRITYTALNFVQVNAFEHFHRMCNETSFPLKRTYNEKP